MDPLDVATIRQDRSVLQREIHGKPLVSLDSAATSQKPRAMIERIQQICAREYARVEEGHALGREATKAYQDTRAKVATPIDAEGGVVPPGWIDPHVHLLGGSGEEGFSTQTPEFVVDEIVRYGVTTVVGCLGVDTTMQTMPGLLATAKALEEEGLHAKLWTGGYTVPAATPCRRRRSSARRATTSGSSPRSSAWASSPSAIGAAGSRSRASSPAS